MLSRGFFLAVGLCLPAGAPVLGQDAEFKTQLAGEMMAALSSLRSTRAHASFVRRNNIRLLIAAPGRGPKDDQFAVYAGDVIYMHKDRLVRAVQQLAIQGVAREDMAVVLAWKALPILVHEIRHGINGERLKTQVGIPCILNFVEDEVAAFHDDVIAAREIARVRPGIWGRYSVLDFDSSDRRLRLAWKRGPDAFEDSVRRLYVDAPSARDDSVAKLSAFLEKVIPGYAGRLDAVRKLKAQAAETDAARRLEAEQALETSWPEERARRRLEELKSCRGVFADKTQIAKLRKFYNGELDRVRRSWRPEPEPEE